MTHKRSTPKGLHPNGALDQLITSNLITKLEKKTSVTYGTYEHLPNTHIR